MYIKCENCKELFYIRPGDFKNKKYKCCSYECGFKNKKRIVLMGNESPNWKGSKIKYAGLHAWVRKLLPKPKPFKLYLLKLTAKKILWLNY